MSEKKKLNQEQLEKVSGGEGWQDTNNIVVKYKETLDGMELTHDLGRYLIDQAQTIGENLAKEWCTTNNMIYVGWYLANLVTFNYDTHELLKVVTSDD